MLSYRLLYIYVGIFKKDLQERETLHQDSQEWIPLASKSHHSTWMNCFSEKQKHFL